MNWLPQKQYSYTMEKEISFSFLHPIVLEVRHLCHLCQFPTFGPIFFLLGSEFLATWNFFESTLLLCYYLHTTRGINLFQVLIKLLHVYEEWTHVNEQWTSSHLQFCIVWSPNPGLNFLSFSHEESKSSHEKWEQQVFKCHMVCGVALFCISGSSRTFLLSNSILTWGTRYTIGVNQHNSQRTCVDFTPTGHVAQPACDF